jgi:membrane protein DedA with SNARE-associated domain
VVLARFVPGLRFAAGPLAGLLGLPFRTFFVANLLGASTYVPVVVGAGYAVGYGLGDYLARFERAVAEIEHVVLVVAAVVTVTLVVWRVRKGRAKR